MKIKANSFLSFGLAVVTLALGFITSPQQAAAQETMLASAKIPFSFHANSTVMPAGTYAISRETGSILKMTQRETGKVVLLSVVQDDRGVAGEHGSLVFAHSGDQYFVQNFNLPNTDGTYKSTLSKKDQMLMRSLETSNPTEIAVNTGHVITR
jgi:hypothetical protein